MKKLLLVSSLFIAAFGAHGQREPATMTKDSVFFESSQDTVLIKSYAQRYNPRKALLYAAVVPGLGQVYNKKYWKLPLVYGGFFFAGQADRQVQ